MLVKAPHITIINTYLFAPACHFQIAVNFELHFRRRAGAARAPGRLHGSSRGRRSQWDTVTAFKPELCWRDAGQHDFTFSV